MLFFNRPHLSTLLLILLCTVAANAWAYCPHPGKLPAYPVKRVVDGDTLRLVDGRSVRLIGVNTPELGRRGTRTEPYAKAAKAALEKLVAANGGKVSLKEGVEAKDHYGRTLAYLFDNNGRSIQAQLLAQGLGFWAVIAPNSEFSACFRDAENTARRAGLALWKKSPLRLPKQIRRSGFALINTQITGVEKKGSSLWLSTDGSLVLQVPKSRLRYFDPAALQALVGQQVEVRGWVIERHNRKRGQPRWQLPLGDKSMLAMPLKR